VGRVHGPVRGDQLYFPRSVSRRFGNQIMKGTGCAIGPISGGCFTAIVDPEGQIIGEPLKAGEGEAIADLDFTQIDSRRRLMDARGH
jgi:nitrilase